MLSHVDHARRLLPSGLTGAGVAGVACCAIPLLLAAGVLSGAGWAIAGRWMPGMTIVLAGLAAAAWWWASRQRHRSGRTGQADCACCTTAARRIP